MSISGVSNLTALNSCNRMSSMNKCNNFNFKGREDVPDSFESSSKHELPEYDKKDMIYHAQTKAAGYAAFGGLCSTLYYGLRSDEKIAKKYNLDPKADSGLVNKIRKEQTIATLPGVFGLGVLGWLGYKVLAKPDKA